MATSVFFGGVGSATIEEVHVYLLPSGNLTTIVYSTTAVTATPDNHISIEPPHYTSVIVKDFGTTDIPNPSACSEFTASF
jgi:hypothetical protein